MITIKTGVQPHHLVIFAAFANAAQQLGLTVRLTSGLDGAHGPTSLHYALRALDFGCKEFSAEVKRALMADAKRRLGASYQVLLEHEGKVNEHIHAEFDP